MAELSLRERLQPALLDRLADDERILTIFQIEVNREQLARLKLPERELLEILIAQGLKRLTDAGIEPPVASPATSADRLHWNLFAPAGRVSLAQLKALVLRPPGAQDGVALQSFCRIETRSVLNSMIETAEHRAVSMRRLREYVLRDLGALLNAFNLETSIDLARFPRVQRSVLNYGMHSLAGLSAAAIDPEKTASGIEEAIRRFEPRLRRVHVAPEVANEHDEGHKLSFRIEAELWGQPVPQQLVLRTRIETDTGNAVISDLGAG